ncbi:hypothetical protein OSB04_005459 [Centaurea solstitialis]|uniref:Uncharacterized protein n=1 Tax=Centaurea solstitialis TaxID=347529 RepID=A0AA38WRG0_9ASTR|nr:hypothetical protein OSB04_005459 [Centaurea solstitialis]
MTTSALDMVRQAQDDASRDGNQNKERGAFGRDVIECGFLLQVVLSRHCWRKLISRGFPFFPGPRRCIGSWVDLSEGQSRASEALRQDADCGSSDVEVGERNLGSNHQFRRHSFRLSVLGAVHFDLGTKFHFSTAYLPQTGGPASGRSRHWKICYGLVFWFLKVVGTYLPLAEISYRSNIHPNVEPRSFGARLSAYSREHGGSTADLWAFGGLGSGYRPCKSYADRRRPGLKFQVGDRVLLRVSPWKGDYHLGSRSREEGGVSFRATESFGSDSQHVPLIRVDESLNCVDGPVEVLERKVKVTGQREWNREEEDPSGLGSRKLGCKSCTRSISQIDFGDEILNSERERNHEKERRKRRNQPRFSVFRSRWSSMRGKSRLGSKLESATASRREARREGLLAPRAITLTPRAGELAYHLVDTRDLLTLPSGTGSGTDKGEAST